MPDWTSQTTTQAAPEQVLAVLTDPDAIRTWSPVSFELEGGGARLAAGRTARVNGQLAGVRGGFDVEVHTAGADGLALTVHGPVALDVRYGLTATDGAAGRIARAAEGAA